MEENFINGLLKLWFSAYTNQGIIWDRSEKVVNRAIVCDLVGSRFKQHILSKYDAIALFLRPITGQIWDLL